LCLVFGACAKSAPGDGTEKPQLVPTSPGGFRAAKGLLFSKDFADIDFEGWHLEKAADSSIAIVDDPARAGRKAVRFTLGAADPIVQGSRRAELVRGKYEKDPIGSERWYGISIFLPTDWATDKNHKELIAQWHGTDEIELGEIHRNPCLCLMVWGDGYRIRVQTSAERIQNENAPVEDVWRAPVEKDKWTDWVFHMKWSYKPDGLLEVWKDGKKIVDRKDQPNCYNDEKGPYFKCGIYKPSWGEGKVTEGVDKRVLYAGEVRVGDETSSFADVSTAQPPTAVPKAKEPETKEPATK